ncbi:MAG: TonB-dependent receptor [Bacteroidaceae bacterium]|nr:TonB-dependent receptor [Bacteroidaceae bacterium]
MKRKLFLSLCLVTAFGGMSFAQDVTVQTGKAAASENDESAFTFTESQLGEDDDAVQSVAALTTSDNDIYLSNVGYLFSPMRFKVRALDSKYNDVYMNGVLMNDAETGRFSFGMIGGLNDATRNQESASAFESNRFAYAPIGGASNINMRASQYATGSKAALSACNRNYLARAMFTHSTGLMNNGWALTASAGYRWANEGVIEGTFYNSFGYFLSAQKKFNDQHSLSLTTWGTPTERAQQGAATEEAYALAGTHYYNPYWGYQQGRKRNSRVVNSFEPAALATWDFTIDEYTKLVTSASFKYSNYSTTALGWNGNAADPRPDYYKNLPSSTYNVWDLTKTPTADEVASFWEVYNRFSGSPEGRQIDWDRLYFANSQANAVGGEALYYVEARHNDQMAVNLSSTYSHTIDNFNRYNAGINLGTTKGMHYKTMADLLGATKYTDVDKFAARDNGYNSAKIQNDLRNPNRQIGEGDIFGYNYNIYVNKARAWGQYVYNRGPLGFVGSAQLNGTTIERYGLMQNGRAADRSYGSSGVAKFLGGGGKALLSWRITPTNILTFNSGYQKEAPLAYNSFIANRIKNDFVHDLQLEGILNTELSYQLTAGGLQARLTGYYVHFDHQVEQTAFYNDSENRFAYLTMNGIEKEHYGVEAAAVYNVTSSLSFTFIGSMGDAYYSNNPIATLTYEDQDGITNVVKNPVTGAYEDLRVIANGCRIGSTPLTALSLGVDYNVSGWFLGANVNYYDDVYVSFSQYRRLSNVLNKYVFNGAVDEQGNPSFGVDDATLEEEGGLLYNADGTLYKAVTAKQPKGKGGFMVDANIGRYIRLTGGRSVSINLTVNNLLNNTRMCTGGYEQNRDDYYYDNGVQGEARTYVFSKNPKLYYANALNAFLNVGFRF